MKTRVSCLRHIVLLLLVAPVAAQAQNSLWIDTVSVGPRQPVHLSLQVSNADTIVAFQCDILLPSQLSYVDNSAQVTSRANAHAHALAATLITPNTLRVIAYSVSGAAVQGNSGAVITFDCVSGILPGTFLIHPANAILSNVAQENVLTSAADGRFVLLAPKLRTNADSIDFGRIPLGQSSNIVHTINNTGNIPLNLRGISSSLPEIGALDSSSATIGAGASVDRTIRFLPVKKGGKTGLITLKSDDPEDSIRTIRVRGYAYAVNELHVGSALARSGYQAKLRLRVNNMDPFTALQCRLLLPPVMKYVNGSATLLSRATDHAISADTVGTSLNLVCFSPSNTAFQGTDGDVVEMTFHVSGQGGDYSITTESSTIADSAGTNIISASYGGTFEISAPLLSLSQSSVNLGNVSAKDTAHFQITISNTGNDTLVIASFGCNNAAFGSDYVTLASLTPSHSISVNFCFHSRSEGQQDGMVTIRSNDATHDPSYISLSATVFWPNELKVRKGSGFRNKQGLIELGLQNMKRIAAVQADVSVPNGLVVHKDSIHLTGRKSDHVSICSEISPGIFRFIAYSPSLLSFSGDSGALIDVPVVAGNSSASFSIGLSNVILSDTAGTNVMSGFQGEIYSVVNRLPVFTQALSDTTLGDNQILTFTYWGMDADEDELKFALLSGPVDMAVSASGVLTWHTNVAQSSIDTVVVSLTDGISTVNDTAIITNSAPVSVEIISFQAVASGNTVLLKWVTARETNCYGFRPERKKPGESNWFETGFVPGSGTANSLHTYTFTDHINALGRYTYRIRQIYGDGKYRFFGNAEIEILAPGGFRLEQNYPNPFNPSTTIRFSLPVRCRVRLQFCNTLGQVVAEILDGELPPGSYEKIWNVGLTSGLYFYRLEAISVDDLNKRFVDVKKMILLK